MPGPAHAREDAEEVRAEHSSGIGLLVGKDSAEDRAQALAKAIAGTGGD